MTKIICDRCEVETKLSDYEYDTFEGHRLKKPIYKCPKCGEEFYGDEQLA